MITLTQSTINSNVAALVTAALTAHDTWRTIAEEAAAAPMNWEMAAREAAAHQVARNLSERARLMIAWEEVRSPLHQQYFCRN
jgi:non-ribosomal peptide synthetase component F